MNFWSKIKTRKAVFSVVGVLVLLCLFGTFVQVKEVVQTGGGSQNPTIVVDCGHGGIDPGKVGINGSYEKDINRGYRPNLRWR